MKKIQSIIQLLRIHQWVKNTFIFLPIFFAVKLNQINLIINDIYAFLGFSLIASAVYVFNDLLDVKEDRLHPTKKNRPIAAGYINPQESILLIVILLIGGCATFYLCHSSNKLWYCVLIYIIQNIAYTIKLKHIPIIDISIIALGFVLRIFVGGIVTDTYLTHWIIIMTFLLALFLALAKRRDDVLIFTKTGKIVRKNIEGYNIELLNALITIMSAIVIVSYIMYATSSEVIARIGINTYMTSFFVIVGVMRYLQITFVDEKSGNPTSILLKDTLLKIIILCWIASFAVLFTNR